MSSYLAALLMSELSTEKIIEIFVQANPRKCKLRVSEYVDGVNSILTFQRKFRLLVKL